MINNSTQHNNSNACCSFLYPIGINLNIKTKMTSIKVRLNCARSNKDGTYPLVVRVIHDRRKREIHIPFSVFPKEFDKETETLRYVKCRKERREYIDRANAYLIYIKEITDKIHHDLSLSEEWFTSDEIIELFHQLRNYGNLFVFAGSLIDKLEKEQKNGTASNYRNTVSAFARFIGNDREYDLSNLTVQVVKGFLEHLKARKLSPNTIWFYFCQLRAIYNKAVEERIVAPVVHPFSGVEIKKEVTHKRAISRAEIEKVADANLGGRDEATFLARDLFMFSLYTRGMAFVDMCHLVKDDLKGDILSYRRQKTGQLLEIRVEAPLGKLLRKYADENSPYLLPMLRPDESYHAFTCIQRKLNKRMRKIGELLEFDFPLTFYVARHSWATLAQDEGVPISIISAGMGHTSESTTHIYLAQIDSGKVDKANRKVLGFLSRRTGKRQVVSGNSECNIKR